MKQTHTKDKAIRPLPASSLPLHYKEMTPISPHTPQFSTITCYATI